MNESYEPRPEQNQETPVYPTYEPYHQSPKKERKKKTGLKIVALALCCSLLGGIVGAGGVVLAQNLLSPEEAKPASTTILVGDREVQPVDLAQIDTGKILTPAEVYAQNVNSTVGITTSITTNFWGYTTTSAASGSGFILTEDGYILTNHHVIEGSNSITVTLYDGTTYDAQLIGYDESLDTAVLKVEAEGLVPVVLGNSDNLNVGDSVIAIGNPLGELTFSLTAGAVSALDREVTLSTTTMDLIQTDCAINSGNSGGALFNLYGEVIGITNAKYSSSSMSEASIDNIGFAIPINDAMNVVRSIIEHGYIAKPYIGVSIMDVSAETQSYGLPQGAAVKEIVEGSPAEAAGLQLNDIITKADDTEISGSNDLVDYIGARAVGDTVKLTVYRQGQTMEITLEIGEQIKSALANEDAENAESQAQPLPQQGGISGFPFFGFGG
ncbi:MAG: trypsin-like peptidase domain-containing protein [Clostridia bacterium]|nr:trypsin-like peptidase domain-containing protein [Clostridia bacterium]